MSTRIGILHPGQMGASVAAAARSTGARVLWASEARGGETRRRAAAAGLEDARTLRRLAAESEVVLAVCPPAAALDVAEGVAAAGYRGVYVDANAIAPATAARVAAAVERSGARFVDGGIIGPPATRPGTTRLYLSGEGAGDVAALFGGTLLDAIEIDGGRAAASALKMSYAAWTKGTAALLIAVRALAVREGVERPLLQEWSLSQPGLAERSERAATRNAPKAWRFEGEMEEIAATFRHAGVPDGFHLAAADVYRRLSPYRGAVRPPDLAEAVHMLLTDPGGPAGPPRASGRRVPNRE